MGFLCGKKIQRKKSEGSKKISTFGARPFLENNFCPTRTRKIRPTARYFCVCIVSIVQVMNGHAMGLPLRHTRQ